MIIIEGENEYKAVFLCKNLEAKTIFMVKKSIKQKDAGVVGDFLKSHADLKDNKRNTIPVLNDIEVWDHFEKKLNKGNKVNIVYNLIKEIFHGHRIV